MNLSMIVYIGLNYQAQINSLRHDFTNSLHLSQDMHVLAEHWEQIEKRWFGPNRSEQLQMRGELNKLENRIDTLLRTMEDEK